MVISAVKRNVLNQDNIGQNGLGDFKAMKPGTH